MTRLLGAILAGGQSQRFGSDKAEARLGGRTLLEHVAATLGPQVGGLVVCGRDIAGYRCVADRPTAGLGPLGGICAALHEGGRQGFDAVVTVPCDTPLLPDDLVARLSAAGVPSHVADLPVIGLWPTSLAEPLAQHLERPGSRAVRRWATAVSSRPVGCPDIANVNTRDDLSRLTVSYRR